MYLAENKPPDALPESSSSRCCAVYHEESFWADRLFALGIHFPTIRFPAFHECRRKVVRSGGGPAINNGRRKEYASVNFRLVRHKIPGNDAAVAPDKLVVGARCSGELNDPLKRNIQS